ncbi:metallophosphoesterase family protein [Bacillus sp. CGMCC 1.16607]|uniref:metallophosphoesterase family protein n=1 Tax=Bacillus sp. CGMCC 1.16607 TaxID=3351842 RepID=UPI00363645A5
MSIKIAVFSDIHGNSSALKAVLEDIDKYQDIEHLYCLGDMIGVGHESNKVLELLSNRNNISYVKGNHDQEIISILNGEENPDDLFKEHHYWIAERIDPKFFPFLFGLSQTILSEYEGKKVLFKHYHLDGSQSFIPVDSESSIKKLDALYHNSSIDMVCFGHHHVVYYFQSEGRYYLNPGPLGINRGPRAKYAIIEIGNTIHIQFKDIEYNNHDLERFIDDFQNLNVPFGGKIINSYIKL